MSKSFVDEAFREVLKHIQSLVDLAVPIPEFRRRGLVLAGALESCPLDTVAFGLANQRLRNVLEYQQQGETGAAAFELKLLRGQLEPLCAPPRSSSGRCPACRQAVNGFFSPATGGPRSVFDPSYS